VDDELLERSRLEKLKRAKKGEPDRQQPTWDQANGIAANVAAKTAESGLIVKLMLNFGVGQAEIKFLRGEHIDLANGVVHFRRKKTGKHFDVPIFPHATGLVEALKAHGRLDVGKPVVAHGGTPAKHWQPLVSAWTFRFMSRGLCADALSSMLWNLALTPAWSHDGKVTKTRAWSSKFTASISTRSMRSVRRRRWATARSRLR
jgi:integrase